MREFILIISALLLLNTAISRSLAETPGPPSFNNGDPSSNGPPGAPPGGNNSRPPQGSRYGGTMGPTGAGTSGGPPSMNSSADSKPTVGHGSASMGATRSPAGGPQGSGNKTGSSFSDGFFSGPMGGLPAGGPSANVSAGRNIQEIDGVIHVGGYPNHSTDPNATPMGGFQGRR